MKSTFIQITVVDGWIYALDKQGQVWFKSIEEPDDYTDGKMAPWIKMTMKRSNGKI